MNGTLNGVLKHLAPGKLTVAPASGTAQAFHFGSQTKTLGAAGNYASNGNVTADRNGYGTSPCTEAQLEQAAKMNSAGYGSPSRAASRRRSSSTIAPEGDG